MKLTIHIKLAIILTFASLTSALVYAGVESGFLVVSKVPCSTFYCVAIQRANQ